MAGRSSHASVPAAPKPFYRARLWDEEDDPALRQLQHSAVAGTLVVAIAAAASAARPGAPVSPAPAAGRADRHTRRSTNTSNNNRTPPTPDKQTHQHDRRTSKDTTTTTAPHHHPQQRQQKRMRDASMEACQTRPGATSRQSPLAHVVSGRPYRNCAGFEKPPACHGTLCLCQQYWASCPPYHKVYIPGVLGSSFERMRLM